MRCLEPLAAVYGWAAMARYRSKAPYRSRLPVLCVGNLTAGGTGKTPLVLYLARRLAERGERPVLLTRGYGGRRTGPAWVAPGTDTARETGDEPLLLARTAPTLIARDRAAGAAAIEAAVEPDRSASIIVMDDGLQNGTLAKDLAIAVVDAGRGFGNGAVIPAGPLRAPLAFQLQMVDALLVNSIAADAETSPVTVALRAQFQGPVLAGQTLAADDTAWLRGASVVAWAGIGAPQRFFALLDSLGARRVETLALADHALPSATDARRLMELAQRHGAMLVTTEKDLARLGGESGPAGDLARASRAIPVVLTLSERDQGRLDALIDTALKTHRDAQATQS